MAYPTLPEEAQKELDNVAGKYSFFIHTQQYSEAQNIITDLFSKMLSWQKQYGQRFHKGYPLHNIGYALYLQNKHEEALEYFILAYIEDLLSADNEDDADSTPAGQTLLLAYKFTPELLQILKRRVKELKELDRIPLQPEEVVRELEESKIDYKAEIKIEIFKREEARLKRFTIFESSWEERCFVGGSIGSDFIIRSIADIVKRLGYDPIVCSDFDKPEGLTLHDKCLVLLHNCKYAVFDIAEQTGQLMELERVFDYGIKTLVIWPKNKDKGITQMLKSQIGFRKVAHGSYEKIEDWESILKNFLPAVHHSPER